MLAGPFDRLESPWLEPQGITPQADDGTVIAPRHLGGHPVVIAASSRASRAAAPARSPAPRSPKRCCWPPPTSRAGTPTAAVILFETGGVRLQEANLGLNAVAEICSALLDLRRWRRSSA